MKHVWDFVRAQKVVVADVSAGPLVAQAAHRGVERLAGGRCLVEVRTQRCKREA